MEKKLKNEMIQTEPLDNASGYCSRCRSVTHFMIDKEKGYYKSCPICGNIEYLHRKFLRFNRESRQWQ
jgi:hypothetical protein